MSEPGPIPPRPSVSVSSSRNRLPANSCTLPPSWQSNASYPNLPLRLDTSIGKGPSASQSEDRSLQVRH
jgi:hypothetical protein